MPKSLKMLPFWCNVSICRLICRGDEEEKTEGGEGRKTYRAKRTITAVAGQFSMVKRETASRKEVTRAMVVVKVGK
jgi:hypothetical protein